MNRTRCATVLVLACCALALPRRAAADPSTAEQLRQLTAEVARLKAEVRSLKASSAADDNRATAAAPPARQDRAARAPAAATAVPATESAVNKLLKDEITNLDLDRPLAAAPAFVALDVSPETVTAPSSPRELATALLSGVDRDGVLQTGLAIETSPYQVFAGRHTSLEDYRRSYLTQLLYNASVSLGTTKAGGEESNAQRLALGFSFLLYDRSDFRLSRELEEIAREIAKENRVGAGSGLATTQEELEAEMTGIVDVGDAFAAAKQKIRARSWAATSWQVAWAPTWQSENGDVSKLRYDGSTVWSTFSYGFEGTKIAKNAQLLAHLRFREGEHVVDAEDTSRSARQDTLLAAARLRFGVPDFNGWIEGGYIRRWGGLDDERSGRRLGVGLERKVAPNTWLVLSGGEGLGNVGDENELFAVGALRFGSADKPRFEVP